MYGVKEAVIYTSLAYLLNLLEKGDRLVKLCLVECEEKIKNLHSWDDGRVYAHLAFIPIELH